MNENEFRVQQRCILYVDTSPKLAKISPSSMNIQTNRTIIKNLKYKSQKPYSDFLEIYITEKYLIEYDKPRLLDGAEYLETTISRIDVGYKCILISNVCGYMIDVTLCSHKEDIEICMDYMLRQHVKLGGSSPKAIEATKRPLKSPVGKIQYYL